MSFDALLKLIPTYVGELLALLAGPRRFFAGQDLDNRKTLAEALLFLLNSAIVAYVLRVPFAGEEAAYWRTAIVAVVLYVPTATALGAVAFGCCRLLGGQGGLSGHVAVFARIAGVGAVALALVQLMAKGMLRMELPPEDFALYPEYMQRLYAGQPLDDPRFRDLAESPDLTTAVLIQAAGLVLIFCWLAWAWRVYADWNRISAARAYAAFALFLVVGYGVSVMFGYAQAAMGVSAF